jgi:hypothetical protein
VRRGGEGGAGGQGKMRRSRHGLSIRSVYQCSVLGMVRGGEVYRGA